MQCGYHIFVSIFQWNKEAQVTQLLVLWLVHFHLSSELLLRLECYLIFLLCCLQATSSRGSFLTFTVSCMRIRKTIKRPVSSWFQTKIQLDRLNPITKCMHAMFSILSSQLPCAYHQLVSFTQAFSSHSCFTKLEPLVLLSNLRKRTLQYNQPSKLRRQPICHLWYYYSDSLVLLRIIDLKTGESKIKSCQIDNTNNI